MTLFYTQLNSGILKKPVVMVKAGVAEELMGLVNKNEEAKVEINIMMETPKWVSTNTNTHREWTQRMCRVSHVCFLFLLQTHYEVGILLTVVSVVLAIIMIFAFRSRCRSNRTWVSPFLHTHDLSLFTTNPILI